MKIINFIFGLFGFKWVKATEIKRMDLTHISMDSCDRGMFGMGGKVLADSKKWRLIKK